MFIFLPRGLDLSSFVEGGGPHPLYDLYAVSNHFGGMGGGHCKSAMGGGGGGGGEGDGTCAAFHYHGEK